MKSRNTRHVYTREEMRPVTPAVVFMAVYMLALIPNDLRMIGDARVLWAVVSARVVAAALLTGVVVAANTRAGGAWYAPLLHFTFAVLVVLDVLIELTRPGVTYFSALPSFLFIAVVYFVVPTRLRVKVVCTGIASLGRMYWMLTSPAISASGAWTIVVSYVGLHAAGISHELIIRRFRAVDAAYRKRLADDVRFKQALANSAWEGILLFADGVVVDVNQRLLEMVGLSDEQVIGLPAEGVFAVADAEAARFDAGDSVQGALVVGTQRVPVRLARRTVRIAHEAFQAVLVEDMTQELLGGQADAVLPATGMEPLTRREREVAQALAEGLSRVEIAERLFIADETVKRHTAGIYRKLGVHSRVELVKLLLKERVFDERI